MPENKTLLDLIIEKAKREDGQTTLEAVEGRVYLVGCGVQEVSNYILMGGRLI